jgi:hypothetical protein
MGILCLTCGISVKSNSSAIASLLSSVSLHKELAMLESASILATFPADPWSKFDVINNVVRLKTMHSQHHYYYSVVNTN